VWGLRNKRNPYLFSNAYFFECFSKSRWFVSLLCGEIILDEVSRVEDLGGSKNFLLHDLCSGVGAGVRKLDIVICCDTNLVTELINLDKPIVLAKVIIRRQNSVLHQLNVSILESAAALGTIVHHSEAAAVPFID
jgi:hypothetical protein